MILKDKSTIQGAHLWTIDWCLGSDHQTGYSEMPERKKS